MKSKPCYYATAPKIEYGRFSLKYIRNQVKAYRQNPIMPLTLLGYKINLRGFAMRTFFFYGFDCVTCKAKGSYFALEATLDRPSKPSLTLYTNKHVMMTCDHKIARALGGANRLENLQPMCFNCNNAKAQIEGKLASLQRENDVDFWLDTFIDRR